MPRPDIATQVRFRKQEEIEKGADKLRADGFTGEVKILTSCPACLQGLSRYDDDAGTTADYIVVEMAKHLLGENWAAQYVEPCQQRRHRARTALIFGCFRRLTATTLVCRHGSTCSIYMQVQSLQP